MRLYNSKPLFVLQIEYRPTCLLDIDRGNFLEATALSLPSESCVPTVLSPQKSRTDMLRTEGS